MGTRETYCKAIPIEKLRSYPGWPSALKENESTCRFLYLHDSLIVTRDIFPDQQVVFDAITDDWRTFCRESLEFAVPEDLAKKLAPRAS